MAKGDFYLLGVQIRLLTRCKILDVALFLHCLQIIFSLKSPSPTLERNMELPNLIWIINLLTRATLLAMAKCIYHIFGKSILGDPEAVSWVWKNGGESFQERERDPLGILLTTSFTTYSNVCLWFGTHTKNNFVPYKRPASIALLSRSSYIRKFNCKLNCSPYMFRFCRRAFFNENARNPQDQRNSVILRFQKKTLEVRHKWPLRQI